MIALARIADRGPLTAAALAAGLLLGALWIPVLIIAGTGSAGLIFFTGFVSMACLVASAAIVAFVVLRHGEIAAIQVALGCLLLLIVVSQLLYGSAYHIPLIAVIYWLPAIVAAFLLARFVRLELAVLAIVVAGVISVVAFMSVVGDPSEFLQEQFGGLNGNPDGSSDSSSDSSLPGELPQGSAAGSLMLSAEQQQTLIDSIARTIPGAFGVSVMSVAFGALFLARSWQAGLFNPGGFQKEFHALSLGRNASLAGVLILLIAFVQGGQLAGAISMVVIFGLFFQGLAVAHALVKQRGMHRYWLHGLYMFVLILPHTLLLLAALGLADNLYSLRGKSDH